MTTKSNTPAKDVALLALQAPEIYPGDMLEDVLTYCFDQLCWLRTGNELQAILDRLAALVSEEA